MLPIPYRYHRAFGFVIYIGLALIVIALLVANARGVASSETVTGALLAVGVLMLVGGTVAWVLVDKPVEDPYEQPPPDYAHQEH
ncbi:MAG: hypothetical protein Kow00120_18690 [Anaerolineae bacterium]